VRVKANLIRPDRTMHQAHLSRMKRGNPADQTKHQLKRCANIHGDGALISGAQHLDEVESGDPLSAERSAAVIVPGNKTDRCWRARDSDRDQALVLTLQTNTSLWRLREANRDGVWSPRLAVRAIGQPQTRIGRSFDLS